MEQHDFGPMVDIHCHLLPGVDDGARSLEISLEMARVAASDGIGTIVVTPHQLGNFSHNQGDAMRAATKHLQAELDRHQIPLRILPGADVRIEDNFVKRIDEGEVLSLADRRKHVLLELPHELYFPLEPVLKSLGHSRLHGILSHPERNQGILRQPELAPRLVDAGCLMQITADSLVGRFGGASQQLCEWMLRQGLVHFVSTDAHGLKRRRPTLSRAYQKVLEVADQETANALCIENPGAVAAGRDVAAGRRKSFPTRARGWFGWKKAG